MDEHEVIQRCIAGQEKGWKEFLACYGGAIYGAITYVLRRFSIHEPEAAADVFAHSNKLMLERYVPRDAITVTLLNGTALGATEIVTEREFDAFAAKYGKDGSLHHTPPRIPQERIAVLLDLAERAYQAIGCSGQARVDFIVPQHADPVILEINTIPGTT